MHWLPTVVRSGAYAARMGWFSDIAGSVETWWRRRDREQPPPDQPASVEAVVARMRQLDGLLPAADGVAAFNRMYLRVTELVLAQIRQGRFERPDVMTRLDIVFAGLYLRQVAAAPPDVDKAWAPLFERRRDRLEPIQFALAGMNAHINHDLPVAVVRTCRQLGLTPRDPGVRPDFDAVTGILAQVHEEVRQSFLDGLALEVDRRVSPVATLVGNWSIAKAREAAWVTGEALWELDSVPQVAEDFRAGLARSVGMVSRYLLTPPSALA